MVPIELPVVTDPLTKVIVKCLELVGNNADNGMLAMEAHMFQYAVARESADVTLGDKPVALPTADGTHMTIDELIDNSSLFRLVAWGLRLYPTPSSSDSEESACLLQLKAAVKAEDEKQEAKFAEFKTAQDEHDALILKAVHAELAKRK